MWRKILKISKTRIIIFAIFSVLIFSTLFFYSTFENWLNILFFNNPVQSISQCELIIHFIDVGQGDSILVCLPDDKIMLVDTGSKVRSDKLEAYLKNFYKTRKDKTLDYLVITHADEDHYGNATIVFENYDVKNCFRPSVFTSSEANARGVVDCKINDDIGYVNFVESLQAETGCEEYFNTELKNPFNLKNVDYSINFLSPTEEYNEKSNDYSTVIQIEYKNRKILLASDIENEKETELVNLYKDLLESDILKVGHHGSSTSTSQNFLDYVCPKYAIICVGKDNDYGHPNKEVIERLINYTGQENLLRTDQNGNILIGIDKDNIEDGKAKILVKTKIATNIKIKVYWWCVVVFVEISCFCIIFFVKTPKW